MQELSLPIQTLDSHMRQCRRARQNKKVIYGHIIIKLYGSDLNDSLLFVSIIFHEYILLFKTLFITAYVLSTFNCIFDSIYMLMCREYCKQYILHCYKI